MLNKGIVNNIWLEDNEMFCYGNILQSPSKSEKCFAAHPQTSGKFSLLTTIMQSCHSIDMHI